MKDRHRARPWKGVLGLSLVLLFLFPLLWTYVGAFKQERDLVSPWPVFWFTPSLESWRLLFDRWDIPGYLANSLIVGIATTAVAVGLGTLAAYALSRFPFRNKDVLTLDLLSLKMVPPIAVAVPTFLLSRAVGLYDTFALLIILNAAFQLPLVILVMKSFFDELPVALDEAALIDGCTWWQIYTRIALPLALPGLVAVSLFVFIFTWNEFLFANVMVGPSHRTLAVVAGLTLTQRGILWGPASAIALLVSLPVLVIALALNRYLVRGLTFGALKG